MRYDFPTDPTQKSPKIFLSQLSNIWVSCDGENPADVENIGPISYWPKRRFPDYYFRYQNQDSGGLFESLGHITFRKASS
jgi:hypothetical protein